MNNDTERDLFDPASTQPTTCKLYKIFLKLAVPAVLTTVLFCLCNVILVIFAGMLDDPIYVAVVGLTWTSVHTLAYSVIIGLNSAQETLTSQAYGSGNVQLCGLYLNRGMVI